MPSPAVVAPESERVVAVNVKRLREACGISQVRLAELMAETGHLMGGMPVWALENGRRRINVDDLFGFAEVFGVTPESLLAPGAGEVQEKTRSQVYEVTVTGGVVRSVTAESFDVGADGFLHFYRQGERVFFAPSSAVLCVAVLQEAADA
jgi:transcriptional regulator with XRE-family HTH domain